MRCGGGSRGCRWATQRDPGPGPGARGPGPVRVHVGVGRGGPAHRGESDLARRCPIRLGSESGPGIRRDITFFLEVESRYDLWTNGLAAHC